MNRQQELIDVIKDIAKKQNHTYDTPATVLRVEGDTVWVHIDGGADETPVRKTINCERGEIVQVRISNGSAFLVGNASAPPTDDKTAKVAHFVAEEAGVKAVKAQDTAVEADAKATMAQSEAAAAQTAAAAAQAAVAQSLITYETWYILSATTPTQPTEESHTGWSTAEPAWSSSSTDKLYFSVRTVKGDGTVTWSAVGMVQSYADLQILKNAIISTVANNYVAQGDSNITELSSTMIQNAHGVNIYNDTLAVGDSYAHIDGDSFDIKEVTTDGQIDDANDPVMAIFGRDGSLIQTFTETQWAKYKNYIQTTGEGIRLARSTYDSRQGIYTDDSGWEIKEDQIISFGYGNDPLIIDRDGLKIGRETYSNLGLSVIKKDLIKTSIFTGRYGDMYDAYSIMRPSSIEHAKQNDSQEGEEPIEVRYLRTKIEGGDIFLDGDVYDYDTGYKKTPTILVSETIPASATSYTFTDSVIKEESSIDVHDTISRFVYTDITADVGSCTITFPAQSSSHKIKLFVY